MRYIVFLALCIANAGCSTVNTISNANDGVVMKGTYCDHIDHVFSGIHYNWCKLHGAPKENSNASHSSRDFEYVGIDSIFSFLADVVVLPYTIYKQFNADPITIWSSEKDS